MIFWYIGEKLQINFHLKNRSEISRIGKSVEIESRLVGCLELGGSAGENEEWQLIGMGFLFGVIPKF